MHVIFIHGPAASGKHTIGLRLSRLTSLPLFHNHLAVDAAKALFEFGTAPFNKLRATVWLTAFAEAAAAGRSFIFTFHPEASVEMSLIGDLIRAVEGRGGRVLFVELKCSKETILVRLSNSSRSKFGKLTDPLLYRKIEKAGGFRFADLPSPILTIDTDEISAEAAAARIARAVGSEDRGATRMKSKASGNLRDGARCRVIGGTHAGKSGVVRDINTSKTGHVTLTVVQANGARFKTLAKNVEVRPGTA